MGAEKDFWTFYNQTWNMRSPEATSRIDNPEITVQARQYFAHIPGLDRLHSKDWYSPEQILLTLLGALRYGASYSASPKCLPYKLGDIQIILREGDDLAGFLRQPIPEDAVSCVWQNFDGDNCYFFPNEGYLYWAELLHEALWAEDMDEAVGPRYAIGSTTAVVSIRGAKVEINVLPHTWEVEVEEAWWEVKPDTAGYADWTGACNFSRSNSAKRQWKSSWLSYD